jgi:hypothetical protein
VPIDHDQLVVQCNEHLELLERLEDGDRFGASTLLQRHLDAVRVSKSRHLSARYKAGRQKADAGRQEADAGRQEADAGRQEIYIAPHF